MKALTVDTSACSRVSQRLMISSVRVENFRCFRHLQIDDLGLVNIIVGKNGAGKTSLLESLFLPGGNPELALRLDIMRGSAAQPITRSRLEYDSLWRDLFYRFDTSNKIKILIKGSPNNHRELLVYREAPGTPTKQTIEVAPSDNQLTSKDIRPTDPLVFETKNASGQIFYVKAVPQANGSIRMDGAQTEGSQITYISPKQPNPPAELATLFSQLARNGQTGSLKTAMQKVFPQIEDITVQVFNGGIPGIFCSIRGIDRQIPIGLVSEGSQNLFALLVIMSSYSSGGVSLIDDIGTGIYYNVLDKMWEAIFTTCESSGVQVFATTHSKECINALLPIVRRSPNSFRLLRVEDDDQSGEHTVKVFSGKKFCAVLETGEIDPRGF